jgi:hypothetical protein
MPDRVQNFSNFGKIFSKLCPADSGENDERKKHMKTITNIIHPALAALVLACFALSPTVRAVDPPPDGGYPNFNTAEGEDALFNLSSGGYNTAIGFDALLSNTTGDFNTATGARAMQSNDIGVSNTATGGDALPRNTEGSWNTANGTDALLFNTTGWFNTAIGGAALQNNTTASNNTAVGWLALANNTAEDNTAVGAYALTNNTTGEDNTAAGLSALYSNTTGSFNTGTGFQALASNTTGGWNTANGTNALVSNTTGDFNTAYGEGALSSNTTGGANTAIGEDALVSNTDSIWNTATGTNALFYNTTGSFNTATGAGALFYNTTGHNNVALGWVAGNLTTTGSYNIDIGNQGVAGESKTIRIGDVVATPYPDGMHPAHTATYIAGIMGRTSSRGTPVFINANGQLGTATSSARFKDAIKPMDKASEAILAFKPVTFHYKKELDPEGIPQFGLVAEDVERVNPDLVVRDAKGEVYTVRYEAVNAMLLNEFLKEHRTVQEQQKEIDALKAELKEQRAFIQKVSDKLELNRPAPQTVANDQRYGAGQ